MMSAVLLLKGYLATYSLCCCFSFLALHANVGGGRGRGSPRANDGATLPLSRAAGSIPLLQHGHCSWSLHHPLATGSAKRRHVSGMSDLRNRLNRLFVKKGAPLRGEEIDAGSRRGSRHSRRRWGERRCKGGRRRGRPRINSPGSGGSATRPSGGWISWPRSFRRRLPPPRMERAAASSPPPRPSSSPPEGRARGARTGERRAGRTSGAAGSRRGARGVELRPRIEARGGGGGRALIGRGGGRRQRPPLSLHSYRLYHNHAPLYREAITL